MAKLTLAIQPLNTVPTPQEGRVSIFIDQDDFLPKYKLSDGSVRNFNGSPEWAESVLSIVTDPSTIIDPEDGDRYLIGNGASGIWTDKDGQIAEFVGLLADYVYTEPTDGMTVKVDDEDDKFYHHEGEYVSGVFAWVEWSVGGGGALKYATSIIMTAGITYPINHALDTEDIAVQAYESKKPVGVAVEIIDANNIEVKSDNDITARIVIIG